MTFRLDDSMLLKTAAGSITPFRLGGHEVRSTSDSRCKLRRSRPLFECNQADAESRCRAA